MKKSVSRLKKEKKLSIVGDLFLPNITPKAHSSRSISIISPTIQSKANNAFQNNDLMFSPGQNLLNYADFKYVQSARNNSLHSLIPNNNKDLLKNIGTNIAYTNKFLQNVESSSRNFQKPNKKTHKYSKSQKIMKQQLDFLKEAYKPRSQIGRVKLDEVLLMKQPLKTLSDKKEKKSFNLETKNSNYLSLDNNNSNVQKKDPNKNQDSQIILNTSDAIESNEEKHSNNPIEEKFNQDEDGEKVKNMRILFEKKENNSKLLSSESEKNFKKIIIQDFHKIENNENEKDEKSPIQNLNHNQFTVKENIEKNASEGKQILQKAKDQEKSASSNTPNNIILNLDDVSKKKEKIQIFESPDPYNNLNNINSNSPRENLKFFLYGVGKNKIVYNENKLEEQEKDEIKTHSEIMISNFQKLNVINKNSEEQIIGFAEKFRQSKSNPFLDDLQTQNTIIRREKKNSTQNYIKNVNSEDHIIINLVENVMKNVILNSTPYIESFSSKKFINQREEIHIPKSIKTSPVLNSKYKTCEKKNKYSTFEEERTFYKEGLTPNSEKSNLGEEEEYKKQDSKSQYKENKTQIEEKKTPKNQVKAITSPSIFSPTLNGSLTPEITPNFLDINDRNVDTLPSKERLEDQAILNFKIFQKIPINDRNIETFPSKDNPLTTIRDSQIQEKFVNDRNIETFPSKKHSTNNIELEKYLITINTENDSQDQTPGPQTLTNNKRDTLLSERLPDIPSRLSLIRHLSNPNFYTMPSIMINSETVALKNENNSNASFESSVMVMEIQNCKDLIKPRTNTPHSLQNIESDTEKEKKKNKPQIFSNELLAAKKETGKAKKNNNYKSSKFVKPNIKINLEIKQSSKRKETQNIKFNRVGSISLNSSIMKKKSLPMKLSQKNSNLNLKNNKKEQEELFSQSRNSETNFFPYELVLDFKKKNPLYNKKFDNLFQSKKTQSRRVEGFKSSHNKVKLTFYSFVEKVKRFFDKNYFNSSIDYHYFPLSSSLPQRSEKAVKETPIFEEQNFSVGKVHKLDTSFGRLSQSHSKNINNNTESNSLSPAWKRNSKNFNQNEIQIPTKNFSKSSKNLGLKFSHSQSPKNIPEFAETVKDKNEEYEDVFEDIVKRIDLKMKEHDDIISTNYIYHNQKNIKTIIIEDFFIYLENMTASNYFFYQSFNPSDQNFRFKLNIFKKILPYHMRSKSISIKNFDKPQTEKYYSILKKQTDFEDTIYTVGEEAAITFQDYLNHSDFKNLQMVIDEEMDESFIDDQFSPLFEKLPMNFDFNEKKRNSLNSNNSLSPKFKSKYLSASTPTNYENRNIFYRDEEEYFYDSNDMLNKKIKDKIFLEYFFDIQKKVRYFLVYVLNDVVCFITRLDLNLVNMKLMKEELKINPNNFIKLDEENEKIYRKEKIIHEMGQTYLKHNKSNYLIFCEENRNLLFGYFEDYFYENLQMGDYYEGDKKKKVNLICHGLPLGVIGKQTSVKSFNSNNEDEMPTVANSDVMKGAFLASRKKLIINAKANIDSFEQINSNKSKNENISVLGDLNFENATKDNLFLKNINIQPKKDDSTKSSQNQLAPSEKNIQDDNFFNKDENSFNILNRRKTNTEMRNHNFKGNSPINQRMNAQISLKKIETKSLFKDSSMKTLLPQIPENELKLPGQKSFKFKKNEEMTKSSGGSPDKKTQPKIYVEIHKNMNNKGLSEKDAFSAISSKLKGENNRTTNEFNLFENSHNDGVFLNRQSLLEKNNLVTMTKNSMMFNNHLIHFNRKKNMNILEQFFFSIKDEKMNELEELFFTHPNIFIDGRDDETNTMLINAARVGNLGMVNVILSKGPNLNLRNKEGNTALHYSLAYGYDDVTNKLLRSGALENIKNNEGKRPWDMLANNF